MRFRSASGGILVDGRTEHFVSEVRREILGRTKVHLTPDQPRQLALNRRQSNKTKTGSRLEFNEHVDIAVRPKVRTQDGSEEREPANVVAPAERLDLVG